MPTQWDGHQVHGSTSQDQPMSPVFILFPILDVLPDFPLGLKRRVKEQTLGIRF